MKSKVWSVVLDIVKTAIGCEEKLAVMIEEVKREITAEKARIK